MTPTSAPVMRLNWLWIWADSIILIFSIIFYREPKKRLTVKFFWNYDPVEAQQLLGITLGNAPIEGNSDGTTDDSKNTTNGKGKEG